MSGITILHTNDLHGKLSEEKLAVLLRERASADLYFDTGDLISAGNLAIPLAPDRAWPRLAEARCTASVLGNRESHVLTSAFTMKLAGATHPTLVANLRRRDGGSTGLAASLELEVRWLRVGVFGVMVPMVTERMASRAASAFLWDQPIPVAAEVAAELRPRVDLLIALTHIGIAQDRKLAEAVPEIDLILGGHSHTVLEQPERIGSTWICQGGSHGRFIGRYVWDTDGKSLAASELMAWA